MLTIRPWPPSATAIAVAASSTSVQNVEKGVNGGISPARMYEPRNASGDVRFRKWQHGRVLSRRPDMHANDYLFIYSLSGPELWSDHSDVKGCIVEARTTWNL